MTSRFPALAMVALLATWSSLATAQTVDTSRVHLGPAEGGTEAFVAWPAGKAAAPGVVVVHEWWGLNAQIREVAKRLAREGYVAIVPDLYHGKVTSDAEQAHVLLRGLEDPVALSELSAAVTWLKAERRTAKRKVGTVGFCMGGSLAQALALQNAAVSATVMFYGSPVTEARALARLRGPLQAHFGQEDDGIPVAKAEALRAALLAAGKPGEVFVYAGAGHAFMHDTRPSYHADASRLGWARMLGFFQKNLKR